MKRYTFPTMSIVVATTIGIASVATPVRAAPGFLTGVVGSICAATGSNHPKINVQSNGAIYNKNTTSAAVINCALPLEFNRPVATFVSFIKRDAQTLSCTFHRRSFNYLSGATSQQSTNVVGTNQFNFPTVTSDFFNSFQCTIPSAIGAGAPQQSGINGIVWQN